jgi:hypothetical protein
MEKSSQGPIMACAIPEEREREQRCLSAALLHSFVPDISKRSNLSDPALVIGLDEAAS